MKNLMVMNLKLFEEGGTGGQGKTEYTFEQAEEITNSRAERASRLALVDFC